MTNSEEPAEAPEGEETSEGISGKKKSKFQTFKNFFAKKKKNKDVSSPMEEPQLEPGNAPDLESILLPSPAETGPKDCTGDESLSHDSIFIPDEAGEISFLMSPPGEVKTMQQVSSPAQPSLSPGDKDSGNDQVLLETLLLAPEVPVSPLGSGYPVDFSTPASPLGCLDTSAARHRIAMNPRKQAAFSKKNQNLPVEQEELLGSEEGKTSPSMLLRDAGQKKDWEGLLIQNMSSFNKDGIDNASSLTSEVLHHSYNIGPQIDGTSTLESESQNLLKTDVWISLTLSSPDVPSPLTNCKREDNQLEDNKRKRNWAPTDDREPQNSGSGALQSSGSFRSKTSGSLSEFSSALQAINAGKPFEAEDPSKPCSPRMDERPDVSSLGSEQDQSYSNTLPLEADPVLPLPSPSLMAPSEASKDLTHKHNLTVKGMEPQPFEGPLKPTGSPQGLLATLDIDPDRTLVDKKTRLPDLSTRKIKRQNITTAQESTSLFFRRLFTGESAQVSSESTSPVDTVGVQPGNAIVGDESDLDEILMMRAKSVPAKPVKFTIAPAWQRSLSGGSSSVDNSCPRSSPTSPIRPELFEAIPSPDTASPATVVNSSERLDGGSRNVVSNWNSTMEWPQEEAQGQENPFGVKLRRTSSLLKYQTEHWDPLKQVPPLASSTASAVKVNIKSPSAGSSAQSVTVDSKSLAANVNFQEKNLHKAKLGEGTPKSQTNKSSEQIPAVSLGNLSSDPKQKLNQKGFQGSSAEGMKKRENSMAATEQKKEDPNSKPPLPKQQVTPSSDSSLKKSNLSHHVGHLENKVPFKSSPLAPKDVPFRIAPRLDQEMRSLPILPGTSCSSAEPPWLSLAKKKAKAWSEMPQAVQ